MAVHRRGSSSVGMLVSALAAATLLQEAFIFWRRPKHELLLQQVAPPPINPSHSRRFIIDALALLASTQDNAAEAAPIQYNAQLAGDLSEAQKRSIKAYLERHKDTPDADVVVGERPLKVYVKPTVEELTPDSPAFKAGRQVKANSARLIAKSPCKVNACQCRPSDPAGGDITGCSTAEHAGFHPHIWFAASQWPHSIPSSKPLDHGVVSLIQTPWFHELISAAAYKCCFTSCSI